MEILSKEMIALLDNEEVRKALDELKDKLETASNKLVIKVPRREPSKQEKTSDTEVTVTLRRLSA